MIRQSQTRTEGYDLARGLAVFGMILVNFKFVMGLEGMEGGALGLLAGLFDGRAAATFVTLAGIGVSLLSRRARESGDPAALSECRKTLCKRALFLLVFGYLDSFLWIGDILHFYAVYLVIAALLLDSSDRLLWGLSAVSIAAFVALFIFLDYEKGWDWEVMSYAGFWRPRGLLRHLFFNGFHPVFPWISFLLIGLWLGRREFKNPMERWKLFAAGAATAALAELASATLTAWAASEGGEEAQWCALLFGAQAMPPTPLYLVAGGGTAVAAIAFCLILAERFRGCSGLEPFVAAGQMALSLYLGHVVLGMRVLMAFGLDEGQALSQSIVFSILFYAGCVAVAFFWRRRFERGPVEWLMRRVAA